MTRQRQLVNVRRLRALKERRVSILRQIDGRRGQIKAFKHICWMIRNRRDIKNLSELYEEVKGRELPIEERDLQTLIEDEQQLIREIKTEKQTA